jgi:predicted secreted hydrolase
MRQRIDMINDFFKPLEQFAGTAFDGLAGMFAPEKPLRTEYASDELKLPDAFFAQAGAQTEWWYYTGHCETASGRRFGFELVFFKRRTDLDKLSIVPMSLLANPIYAAHFAVSDISRGLFQYDHIRSFGSALDMPVAMSERSFDVQMGDWSVREVGGKHVLHATLDGVVFDAILEPAKPLVLNGDDGNGVSRKMKGVSRHFSYTRMNAVGTITTMGRTENFTGSAWMDREYGAWEQTNWDWFSIQFDDRTELMIYQFRTEGGSGSGDSTGTFVDADGNCKYLTRAEFEIETLGTWKSYSTGVEYPSGWRVRVPKFDIDIEVKPLLKDQELDTRGTTMVVYWEGACSVAGRKGNSDITGNAYVELVGYDRTHEELDVMTFLFKDPLRRMSRLF